jgi:hypothetical protein
VVNGQRVSPATRLGEERGVGGPVYECRLERGGVGRIEVEVLAEKRGVNGVSAAVGAGEGVNGTKKKEDEVDREKVVLFVHVMR